MTSPATRRLVGLLLIVGVVAGCGGEKDRRDHASAIAGTYRVDVERTVEQAVAMWLVHDREWKTATTDTARAEAEVEFRARELHRLATVFPGGGDRLTVYDNGTWVLDMEVPVIPDIPEEDVARKWPKRGSGRWSVDDGLIVFVTTHVDGMPQDDPYRWRRGFVAGTLYVPAVDVQTARGQTRIGEVTEDGGLYVGLTEPVYVKE